MNLQGLGPCSLEEQSPAGLLLFTNQAEMGKRHSWDDGKEGDVSKRKRKASRSRASNVSLLAGVSPSCSGLVWKDHAGLTFPVSTILAALEDHTSSREKSKASP